jgi:hypothetical protein
MIAVVNIFDWLLMFVDFVISVTLFSVQPSIADEKERNEIQYS